MIRYLILYVICEIILQLQKIQILRYIISYQINKVKNKKMGKIVSIVGVAFIVGHVNSCQTGKGWSNRGSGACADNSGTIWSDGFTLVASDHNDYKNGKIHENEVHNCKDNFRRQCHIGCKQKYSEENGYTYGAQVCKTQRINKNIIKCWCKAGNLR